MVASITRQGGLSRLEWAIVALTILVGGSVVVSMCSEGWKKERYMETAAIPLIEALDRYHAVNKSYPENLEKLVPTYIRELPGCTPHSEKAMPYFVDKDSGEYF